MTENATEPEGTPSAAHDVYTKRLEQRRKTLANRTRLESGIADARLYIFILGLILVGLVWWLEAIAWWWLLGPLAVFATLVIVHDRVRRGTRRAQRAVEFYEKGLKRLDGSWPGTGVPGDRFLDVEHPYAADLDLFGKGSLFERICTARTRSGEETLASWLLSPAETDAIRARQEAVAELRNRLDLREDLEMLGAEVREGIDPEALITWGKEPAVFRSRRHVIIASLLAFLAILGVLAWIFTELGTIPLLSVVLIEIVIVLLEKAKLRHVIATVDRRTHDLVLLAELLARIEREKFQSPALSRARAVLETVNTKASRKIGRLASLLNWLMMKDNQAFAPIAFMLMWTNQFAYAIDAWRVRTGPSIAGWLAAVGEFEALIAFASYSYENPSDPFPLIEEGKTCFEGIGAGHPLIREPLCVRNDISLCGNLQVLLVSGSNMSGKSTILRTIGTNTVLALAGAPVHAKSLRVSVLSIGATLRIQDSLQAGKSRFFAELTRVRMLVDLAKGPRPLLFLLDEIFHGTNSHDRTVGAGAVVKGLIDHGAIGLVTTHDLALAEFAERLAPRARNVHFEDQFIDGVMHFNYKMQPGVVTHSNAIALMRAVGLEV